MDVPLVLSLLAFGYLISSWLALPDPDEETVGVRSPRL